MSVRQRLNVSFASQKGDCTGCGDSDVRVVTFHFITESHSGSAEALCARCVLGDEGNSVDVPLEELSPGRPSARKGFKKRRQKSVEQELEVAEMFGARRQPNSGATPGAKGDIRKKGVLRGEMKFTEADSFRLEYAELQKIRGECGPKEKPLLVVDFVEKGTRKLKDRFAVVLAEDLKEWMDAAG